MPPIKALERGLRLLEILERSEGLELNALARLSDLPASTTHRLLMTMQKSAFVRLDPSNSTWSIGVRAFEVGQAFARQADLVSISRPTMTRLMHASEETVSLGRFELDEIIFISQVETRSSIRAFFPPGERGPLHASGCGKAVMATWPSERVVKAIAAKGIPSFTERTIQDLESLHQALADARRRGWAINDEEHTPGMRCVAAPIFGPNGQAIAAISISGPSARISDRRMQELGGLARDAAIEITHALGGTYTF